MRIKVEDITDNEVEMASLWILELLKKNDPLTNATIAWFKGWFDLKGGERVSIEDIKIDLQKSRSKRKDFYRAFRNNCEDKVLQAEFYEALKEFMERKC